MTEITTLLACLHPLLSRGEQKLFQIICLAMLSMNGRVTMLGISRWTEKGGSYRTLQRFFSLAISWETLNLALVRFVLCKRSGPVLVAGDATTVTKSGKKTAGIGRFFSSIYGRPVPGLSFQCLSLVDVKTRKSWPVVVEQVLPTEKKKPAGAVKKKSKRKKGRPEGSKNRDLRNVDLEPGKVQVLAMLRRLMTLADNHFSLVYFVYDGAFGNNAAVRMTRQAGLHLISKLQRNSALYFLPEDRCPGKKGAPRRYGKPVKYESLHAKYLRATRTKGNIHTRTYQFQARHKKFANTLNVVVICKTNRATGKTAHVTLFSSDPSLGWKEMVDYYALRFQIEFNFRDAKQHWGLEDFMVTDKTKVLNSACLSLWMVNLSQALLPSSDEASILDLKAHYHGLHYAKTLFKILPENAGVINIADLLEKFTMPGRIHEARVAA